MVLGAALAYPGLREVRGIELVPELHEGALEAHAWLCARLREESPRGGSPARAPGMPALALPPGPTPGIAKVALCLGDILVEDWSDADVVLATSLCFPPVLLARVYRLALGLREGAKFVCMQQDLLGGYDEEELEAFHFMQDEGKSETAQVRAHGEGKGCDTGDAAAHRARGANRQAASPRGFRPVPLGHDDDPPHMLLTTMSWGEARFYVYERTAVEEAEA